MLGIAKFIELKAKTERGYEDITGFPTLNFRDKTIIAIIDVQGGFDQITCLNTDSERIFRLYNAAFSRLPDRDGLKYWIEKFSSKQDDEKAIASSFLVSDVSNYVMEMRLLIQPTSILSIKTF